MIEFQNVTKRYEHDVVALSDINVKIENGEFVFLVGPSGSGKSTFLKLLLKEEIPSDGTVYFDGVNLAGVREKDVPYVRRKMGCVFQDFRLLYDKTVYENIVLALRVIETSDREIKTQVAAVIDMVGLKGKENAYPNQLSGGEQQRVGLARALVTRPPVVIADEPTGNLDDETAQGIMNILYEVNNRGTTVLMVTHSKDIISRSNKRVITLQSGKIISDTKGGNA
ncbi:MAG: cell division ATP-binding protein FtsE [Clostridia bacterium]|nr:cell division ATP-binding protein FtsE [Clostridia bacterium]